MTVTTQLYYQVYITYQLHVSANAAVAIIGLDTIYQRGYNNCSVLYHICIASLINCIQPDDGHSSIGRNM